MTATMLNGAGFSIAHFQANNRALDFLSVKHACPDGIYVVPLPDDATIWDGVLFARHGPYMPAVLRFQIHFPSTYPHRPPQILFVSDVFHPLITPLTTYTHSNQDIGAETISASDQERLAPGSFSLKHGFPQWYTHAAPENPREFGHTVFDQSLPAEAAMVPSEADTEQSPLADGPHILQILYHMKAAFTQNSLLDQVSQENAANPSAWHAWQSFRSHSTHKASLVKRPSNAAATPVRGVLKQQPGGARSPAEWNWGGVWEDRVRKSIQASLAEQTIYKGSGQSHDLIRFVDIDPETLQQAVSSKVVEGGQTLSA